MKVQVRGGCVAGGVLTALLVAGLGQASHAAQGYVVDSSGNIVRSGSGGCIHTGTWTPEMATIVGCDGVTLDAKVEVVRGEPTGLVSNVVMPSTAMFAFDSAELTAEGKEVIEEYRAEAMPELATAYGAIIIGHTDSQGDPEYNRGLALRRAEAVRDYLVSTGVPADKLRVFGLGASDPIGSNDTTEGRAENRRVEVIVVGELRALDAMRFPSVALFERRSAELTEEGRKLIDKHRKEAEEQFRRAEYIEIVGHTDDVGDDAYNRQLSEQRAQNVYEYLAGAGMDVARVAVVGMGETAPIASNQTPEGRAENRRVEILVLGRQR